MESNFGNFKLAYSVSKRVRDIDGCGSRAASEDQHSRHSEANFGFRVSKPIKPKYSVEDQIYCGKPKFRAFELNQFAQKELEQQRDQNSKHERVTITRPFSADAIEGETNRHGECPTSNRVVRASFRGVWSKIKTLEC